jgi:hypothetical protein
MTSTLFLCRFALAAVLIGTTAAAGAQGASAAKKDLVQKVLKLNQAGIEAVGTQLAGQTASQAMQAASQAIGRLPADKRDAVAAQVQGDVRKFYDETAPLLRDRAVKLAPATLGAALEEKFSEDELRTLLAWLESPVSRKYQQMAGEQQQALAQKLIEDTRAQIEPKLKTLDQTISTKLSAAAGASKAAPAPKK